jgi:polyhydroxyalkanoate synthase
MISNSYSNFNAIGNYYYKFTQDSLRLLQFYNSIYFDAFSAVVDQSNMTVARANNRPAIPVYRKWLEITDHQLEIRLRTPEFSHLLSELIESGILYRRALRDAGHPIMFYDWLFDLSVRNMILFSSGPLDYDLSAFEIIFTKGKTRLLHYKPITMKEVTEVLPAAEDSNRSSLYHTWSDSAEQAVSPLLIVYAPINRFHIMDATPNRSVVRSLLQKGLDVYLLDWGFPDWDDSGLALQDYVQYVREAVNAIKNRESDKVSILGYCWGGIISLIYAALNNNSINKLAIMATPVDFAKDTTILATWSRSLETDMFVDEFGHMDGQVLDLGFLMRNPPRYMFDKYLEFLKKANDSDFVQRFLAVERWLHDTPNIPGTFYKQIINDCYKDNLLIAKKMRFNEQTIVDLGNISVPLLTIVANDDDLVSPASTIAIDQHVSSKNKSTIAIPVGHVGLCVSSMAHSMLWPQVAKWFLETNICIDQHSVVQKKNIGEP